MISGVNVTNYWYCSNLNSKCFHFSRVLRSGITESYGKYIFNFIRNYQTVFKVALPFYIFTSDIWELQLLCTLANIWCCQFSFHFYHFSRYVVVSCGGFNLHSCNDCWCWTLFFVLIWHLYLFFCEMFVQIFHPVLKIIIIEL